MHYPDRRALPQESQNLFNKMTLYLHTHLLVGGKFLTSFNALCLGRVALPQESQTFSEWVVDYNHHQ